MSISWRSFLSAIAMVALGLHAAAGEPVKLAELPGVEFATPVKVELLDLAAFSEWVDGSERRIEPGKSPDHSPQWVLCTATTTPGHSGLAFGDSKQPGPRHLRIGFQQAIPAGTVFAQDGGSLSVLKAGAPYPGDLNDESQWLPAQRMEQGQPVTAEVSEKHDLGFWVLPPGTRTRALRFTHVAKAVDEHYAGKLSGVIVLPERFSNEAWDAVASASSRNELAANLVNSNHDGWTAWENEEKGQSPAGSQVVSEAHPEWVTLTWPKPVELDGLIAFWAGIAKAEVQTYVGPGDRNPRDGEGKDWQGVGLYEGLQHQYATRFWPNRLAFSRTLKTRAVRLRILEAGAGLSHASNNEGHRTWLGELLAVRALKDDPLKAETPLVQEPPHPPVPVRFHLEKPGFVSLVIEKPDGFRVRNLIAETWFPAGDNVAWWDGCDDLGRDADAAEHGLYRVPLKPVEPGAYRVRGVVRGEVSAHYEFSVYAPGDPPWDTEDSSGAWLANHTPPQSAAFVTGEQSPTGQPAVYLGCFVTEGPSGLAWVDLDGHKLGGKKWLGGNWTAAPFLARDGGTNAVAGVQVYAGSAWQKDDDKEQGELRITALTKDGDKAVLKHPLGRVDAGTDDRFDGLLGGLAAHDGIVVASLTEAGQLLVIDAKAGQVLKTIPLTAPRGIAYAKDGALLALSGTRLLRFGNLDQAPVPLIEAGLEEPMGLTVDEQGAIYISDHGASHQVKIFTAEGKFLRAIGKPGVPQAGPYDPLHMNHPLGMAVDSKQQLWVTERDFVPKRVSVWSTEDGHLIRAFYGPAKYGGGGALDPQDKTKFYYADEGRGSMQFDLDWEQGTSRLSQVLYRPEAHGFRMPVGSAAPEAAIYQAGRRYLTNCYNSNPTGGAGSAFLFTDRDGSLQPVAGMGNAAGWEILKSPEFRARWPEGVDPAAKDPQPAFFLWSDLNGDSRVQPEEVEIGRGRTEGVTVMPDLSFCLARLDDRAMRISPVGIMETGVPVYDGAHLAVMASGVEGPRSSGGDQALTGSDGWSVVTLGLKPFDPLSLSGARDGVAKWSYPSLWPGLHASHTAPRPDRPGEIIGTTRLPGGMFEVAGSDAGPLWAIHSNHGRMAVFTQDGIFVTSLFQDMRGGKGWRMPKAVRNMDLEGMTLGEENFWPTLTNASAGKVYLVDGGRSAIIRLDGLETLRRLPDAELSLSAEDLARSQAWQLAAEAERQKSVGSGVLRIAGLLHKPLVDGKLDEWGNAEWVEIDKSGVKANFDARTKPYDITAALAISGDRLYAAWRTGEKSPLKNSGAMPLAPFKTGDALDLMLGPAGDRKDPVAGDLRLIVTVVKGNPWAMLYRPVVPGTKQADKVPFSSPWRTIAFDQVEDVSDLVEFSGSGDDGNYEISIPLAKLGLRPVKGGRFRGDIGILRGDGTETHARTYWSNKATGITADVPDEAMLTPGLWGTFEFP